MAELDKVTIWAEALIKHHLPQQGWSFGFDNAKRRAGQCNHTHKKITVSRYLAAKFDDDEVHQILLHEVAHALAGPQAGHGAQWVAIAADLGYVGGRTHTGEIAHEIAPWVGSCPGSHEHVRFRKPARLSSCGICSKTYSAAHLIRWRKRGA